MWNNGNIEYDFLLEEYRSLRQEINDANKARKQVIAFGLACLGVIVNIFVLKVSDGNHVTYAFMLALFAAMLCVVVLIYYFAESKRVRRAGWHLYGIEKRVNDVLESPALSWETKLRSGHDDRYKLTNYHHGMVFFMFFLALMVSVFAMLSTFPLILLKEYVYSHIWFVLAFVLVSLCAGIYWFYKIRKELSRL